MTFDFVTVFKEISNGDEQANECLNALFAWFHALDDLVDRDKPVLLTFTMLAHLKMVECISSNVFFQKHKAAFLPLFQAAALAYLESERFRLHANPLHRIGSQVLKSQYQDIFYAVARFTGGDEFMVRMSQKYRDFDFDPTPKP